MNDDEVGWQAEGDEGEAVDAHDRDDSDIGRGEGGDIGDKYGLDSTMGPACAMQQPDVSGVGA